jgi:putative tryptophan/tyrosine transport system substrate-binding protein
MRRRILLTLIGGAAAIMSPLAFAAERAAMPVIGFLNSRSPGDTAHLIAGFRNGLAEGGYFEGQNVGVEYRWALGQYERLPELALELARRPVAVIVASGGDPVGVAAKAATSTIPIIFVVSGDPAKMGLAESFPRPGGNSTGLSIFTSDIGAKRLGLLRELVPNAVKIAFLSNPTFPTAQTQLDDVHDGARALGVEIDIYRASTETEIDAAFTTMSVQHPAGLIVAADPFFDTRRTQLIVLTARCALPAIYHLREYVTAGGLISYGIDLPDVYRQMGIYAGKILNGANPANLPVMRPSRFELVINLQTARTLSLQVPESILASANAVIE